MAEEETLEATLMMADGAELEVGAVSPSLAEVGVQCTLLPVAQAGADVNRRPSTTPAPNFGHRPSLTGMDLSNLVVGRNSVSALVTVESEFEGTDEEELNKVDSWIKEIETRLPQMRRRIVAIHAKKEFPDLSKLLLDRIVKLMKALAPEAQKFMTAPDPAAWRATKSENPENSRRRCKAASDFASNDSVQSVQRRVQGSDPPEDGPDFELRMSQGSRESSAAPVEYRSSDDDSCDAANSSAAPRAPSALGQQDSGSSNLARSFRRSIAAGKFLSQENTPEFHNLPSTPPGAAAGPPPGSPKTRTKTRADKFATAPEASQVRPPEKAPPPVDPGDSSVQASSAALDDSRHVRVSQDHTSIASLLPKLVPEEPDQIVGQAEFTQRLSMGALASKEDAPLEIKPGGPSTPKPPLGSPTARRTSRSYLSRLFPTWNN